MGVIFEPVSHEERHICTLYELLSKRNHNISHQTLPSYEQHSIFVRSHPYRKWFLVKISDVYVGSFYITFENTVGINLLDDFIPEALPLVIHEIHLKFKPLPEIKSVRSRSFSVNVAPTNLLLISALEQCGCVISQVSYLLP